MAGGMDRRPFRSANLAERTRSRHPGATGADAASPSPTSPALDALTEQAPAPRAGAATAEPRRHCWVVDGVEPARRAAGLLVEWRQLAGAWQGRVAYVVGVDGEPTLVEAWLPASQLRQADGG